MRREVPVVVSGLLLLSAQLVAQVSPCDLSGDGVTNVADVNMGVSMILGLQPCTATVMGPGICNVIVVQRIANAALGGACVASASRSVTLNWTASPTPGVTGYNVLRATSSGGPYTKVNTAPITGTTYTDNSVMTGQTYHYVTTAVTGFNVQSSFSNQTTVTVNP